MLIILGMPPESQTAPIEKPYPDGRLNPANSVEVAVTFPEMDQILEDPDVPVVLELANFEAKPGGPHVHLVLDNQPFQEYFDLSKPFVFHGLSRGTHVLAVFAVTSWHESWKNEEALALIRFHVQEKSRAGDVDLEAPLLIFNMPQGTVEKVKGQWVLLDFLVKNVTIPTGSTQIESHRVNAILDGRGMNLEYLEPRFLKYVDPGPHRIGVQLTDRRGRLVPNGNWNRVVRTFRIS